MKRTKIVCTIGPASASLDILAKMGNAGMDVARLNFSHGDYEDHARLFKRIEATGKKIGHPFGVLQDLQGPKIRVGSLPAAGVHLQNGKEIIFTVGEPKGEEIPVTLPTLNRDIKPRERLLLDDGLLEVEVRRVIGDRILCEVIVGGKLTSHKGINLPGTKLHIPALSEKDRADARFGAKLGVHYVALSFVRSSQDVKDLRMLLDAQGARGKAIKIIAKIEKREAVDSFDAILPLCDAIMVARGDLGIEMPAAQVPVIQKQLIAACRERGTPVIVATQMLDSMQRNPRPTRAEVSDIENAVFDHADAVMLSGETASGAYPVESVKAMHDAICVAEESVFDDAVLPIKVESKQTVSGAIGETVRVLADALGNPPIIVATASGRTVKEISCYRPQTPIYAYTTDAHVARALKLVWGVVPHLLSKKVSREQVVALALRDLKKEKMLKAMNHVIVVTGSPMWKIGSANSIEIITL